MAGWDTANPSTKPSALMEEAGLAPGSIKTLILVPHGSLSDWREWRDWFYTRLQKPEGTYWLETRGQALCTARNYLVKQALETSAERFLFLDDDVIAPDDSLISMVQTNFPIVCGLYMAKKAKGDRGLAAWQKNPHGTGYLPIDPKQNGRYVSVDVTGMGFALIHRSVFEKVSYPWFDWPVEGPSEDFWFFEKAAREIGVKPVIDREVSCLHIGIFTVDCNDEFSIMPK